MKPFLRATDRGRLAPVGWISEPAGVWGGKEVDVVYDPRRHDVMFTRSKVSDHVQRGFREVGYRRTAVDGSNEMWVRDRLAVISTAMDRVERQLAREQQAQISIGGRGL